MKTKRDVDGRPALDEIDNKIIDAMVYNARISNAALAKIVGLSESATLERVRRLEKSSVILGYSTRIDPKALNHNVTALVTIRLTAHTNENLEEFRTAIRSMDEVLSCFQVMGSCDYVAHVASDDVAGLEQFLTQRLLTLSAVDRTESMFVLKTLKQLHDPPSNES